MEALVLFGAPPERFWPYDGRPAAANPRYELEPTSFCYAFASNYQAIKYFRLDPPGVTPAQVLQNIKQYLAAGFPSIFGFPVYSEYDAAQRDPSDGHSKVPFPAAGSQYRGGHAVLLENLVDQAVALLEDLEHDGHDDDGDDTPQDGGAERLQKTHDFVRHQRVRPSCSERG